MSMFECVLSTSLSFFLYTFLSFSLSFRLSMRTPTHACMHTRMYRLRPLFTNLFLYIELAWDKYSWQMPLTFGGNFALLCFYRFVFVFCSLCFFFHLLVNHIYCIAQQRKTTITTTTAALRGGKSLEEIIHIVYIIFSVCLFVSPSIWISLSITLLFLMLLLFSLPSRHHLRYHRHFHDYFPILPWLEHIQVFSIAYCPSFLVLALKSKAMFPSIAVLLKDSLCNNVVLVSVPLRGVFYYINRPTKFMSRFGRPKLHFVYVCTSVSLCLYLCLSARSPVLVCLRSSKSVVQ